jgi:hypothetical protein
MARGNSRAESEYANPFGAAKYAKGEEPKTGGFSANELKYGSDSMMKTIGPRATRAQIDETIARGEMYANQDENASQREKAVFDSAKEFASQAKSLLADFTIDGRYKGKGEKKVFEAVSMESGQVVSEYELDPDIAVIRQLQQLADKSYAIGSLWTDDQATIDRKAIMSPEARGKAIQEDNREYYTSPGGLSSIIVAGRRQDINEAASLGAGLRAGGMTEGDLKKISILVGKARQDRVLDRYIRDKDNAGEYGVSFRVRK